MELRALLLCPDARSAQLLGEILAEQGIAVDQVSDSAAALESVATRRFDALILDADDEERAKEILSKARLSAVNSGTLVVALVASTSNVRQSFPWVRILYCISPFQRKRTSEPESCSCFNAAGATPRATDSCACPGRNCLRER